MKLLCLANSYKEKGRCVAGVLLDEDNQPVIENEKPIWIRPVYRDGHGQIPNNICEHVQPLDIIELKDAEIIGEGYQSENTTYDENRIVVIGKGDMELINDLYADTDLIFGNRGKAVNQDVIKDLDHSLIIINTTDFEIFEKEYDGKKHPQIRLKFNYRDKTYDFPITDPAFLKNYGQNKGILDDKDNINLVLSLGIPLDDWHYKLVATVLY